MQSPYGLMLLLLLATTAHGQDAQAIDFNAAAAEHLLNRAGFGGTPDDCARLVGMGLECAVAELLAAPANDALSLVEAKSLRPSLRQARAKIPRDLSEKERADALRKVRRDYRRADRRQLARYRAQWFEHMVSTPHPLAERMVVFWHGHFTSGYRDVRNSYHMIVQNRLFRRHALGNFRTLLHAVAKDPAMLEYLDNNRNRKGRPNENFAREVMELFTLGAGNYTEKDIKEAARAFTGWTFRGDRFVIDRRRRDHGKKTVLGRTGNLAGEVVLDLLLEQDAAPRWIAGRLLRHFLGVEPGPAIRDRYARLLRENDWEIRPVLAALFTDPEFYAPEIVGGRILGPVDLLVGDVRRLGAKPSGSLLDGMCSLLGQELFQPPDVKGWDGGAAWISTSSYLARGNMAGYLVEGVSPHKLLDDFASEQSGRMDRQRGEDRRQQRGRGMGRAFGVVARARYRPTTRLRLWVVKASDAADVVDTLCNRLLAVPVTREARASLIAQVQDENAEGFELPGEARLRRLARVILSLPEAQLG